MMEIFYYGCEFVYTAAIVLAIFTTLDVVMKGTVTTPQTECVKYITTVVLATMKVLNVYTGSGLFSNLLTWTSIILIASVSKGILKKIFWMSLMITNLIWSLVAIGDFFVHTVMCTALRIWRAENVLMTISGYRGVYLLIWGGLIGLYIKRWLPKVEYVLKTICLFRFFWIATPVLLFCLVYFQRIYAEPINGLYLRWWWGFSLGLILFSVGVLVYFIKEKEKNNVTLLQIKCGMLEEQYQQILEERKEKDILLHDLKNHLLAISGLAEDGQVAKIQLYVQEMYHILGQREMKTATGHPFLDLILDQKTMQAKKVGIKVDTETGDLSDVTLSELEICALFSNLLDNAIEANEQLGDQTEKWIRVVCKRQNKLLIIHIMNPTVNKVSNGEIPMTSKSDKAMHGFGLRSVQQIVDGHEGVMSIRTEHGEFDAYICVRAFG